MGTPCFLPPNEIFRLMPGSGEFTCCALNHCMDGKPIACDKPKIRAVLVRALEGQTRGHTRPHALALTHSTIDAP